jgi:hypothetical protein
MVDRVDFTGTDRPGGRYDIWLWNRLILAEQFFYDSYLLGATACIPRDGQETDSFSTLCMWRQHVRNLEAKEAGTLAMG